MGVPISLEGLDGRRPDPGVLFGPDEVDEYGDGLGIHGVVDHVQSEEIDLFLVGFDEFPERRAVAPREPCDELVFARHILSRLSHPIDGAKSDKVGNVT